MMKKQLTALLLCALSCAPAASQTPARQQPDPQDEIVRVSTNEIVLDAVVRDRKGRVVKDLKPTDFEVFEDGARQQVTSFHLVSREPNAPAAGGPSNVAAAADARPGGATPTPSARRPEVARLGAVAIVFDRLSPDARARARQAALSYVAGGLRPDDFVGVFGIDLSLRVLQPFTNNEQLVRNAIDREATHSPSTHSATAGQIADVSQQQAQLQAQGDQLQSQTSAAGAATDTQAAGSAAMANAADQAFAEMTQRSLETFEMLERNQQGYATTNGLLAVVNALSSLPGRKVLLFFSEGVAIPTDVQARFRAVISNANRAGVSIYSVDAAGLRATSADQEAGRALTTLGQQRMRQAASNREPGSPMMRDLERNEDLMRSNPNTGLGELAEQTGGFLISNTNNPAPRLRQMDEDLHTYYVLSYRPTNQNFDGRFRQISVKLSRPDLEVQARRGYYATNVNDGSPLLAYEAPALALLSGARSGPDSFPVRAAAFNFPRPEKPGLVPVVLEVPPGAYGFDVDSAKKTYRTDFSVVALVKDESQRVVAKLSNQYALTGPAEKLEAARRGAVLFYREADLRPGRYTIAAAVYDALTGRGATTTASVVVPPDDSAKPRLASVVIIKRAERWVADDDRTARNPFRFGELLIYPNLGEPLSKSESKDLPFLLTLYATPDAQPPKATLEIAQGSRTLARAPLTLPAPDAAGRIQFASAVPIDKLAPGDYDLRVTATDARGSTTRSEHFTLRP
jgi:VWFA-related protein